MSPRHNSATRLRARRWQQPRYRGRPHEFEPDGTTDHDGHANCCLWCGLPKDKPHHYIEIDPHVAVVEARRLGEPLEDT